MPEGQTHVYTTDGVKGSRTLQTILGLSGSPVVGRSWTVRFRSDPGNGSNILVGRGRAVEPLLPGDSVAFDFARYTNLCVDDQGVSGLILYVDDAGTLDPGDLGIGPGA
jgi:hypothetical protein